MNGFQVLVLEGHNRPGGRVYTKVMQVSWHNTDEPHLRHPGSISKTASSSPMKTQDDSHCCLLHLRGLSSWLCLYRHYEEQEVAVHDKDFCSAHRWLPQRSRSNLMSRAATACKAGGCVVPPVVRMSCIPLHARRQDVCPPCVDSRRHVYVLENATRAVFGINQDCTVPLDHLHPSHTDRVSVVNVHLV